MTEFLLVHYDWLLTLHILAVISWMVGMLYLPRLFVYHAGAEKTSETSETFKIMERRLLRSIMTPAMLATLLFGGLMLMANPDMLHEPWMHTKLTCVFLMAGLHGYFAKTVKTFARDANTRPSSFYRWLNEMPTVLMIIIVLMVVVRPF
jgi:putative membrane protein